MSSTHTRKDSIGDRMKTYENVERRYLTKRMPTLIRIDGKAFHNFTKGFQRPFDPVFAEAMWETAKYLCKNVMGCKAAYVQSDEITLLLTDWDTLTTQAWFDKNINKMVSVSASMATMAFNNAFAKLAERDHQKYVALTTPAEQNTEEGLKWHKICKTRLERIGTAMFDGRVWNVPKEEVVNNFIWRQQDATRNAIQMLAQSEFSHKELHGKSCDQIQELLFQERNINFNDLPTFQKRGACVIKETYDKDGTKRTRWVVDKDIPIFTADREYIEKFLETL